MPDAQNNRERPQAKKPSKCLSGQSYGETLAKEPLWLPATRGLKKGSDRAITPGAEAVCIPTHLAPQGPRKPSGCTTFTLNSHWGRAATGKKMSCACVCRGTSVVSTLCDSVDCGLPGFSVRERGLSRQEYWSILADTGCLTLLEHCISCCPSRQLPWVPGAAWPPATQAAAPPPHLALTEANPSPPGQPQRSVRGHPREVRWTVTPSEGKDYDSSDSRKTSIILMFWLVPWMLLDFFFPSPPPIFCSCQFYWHYEI